MKSQVTVQKPPTKCYGLLSVRSLAALMCAVLIIISTAAAVAVTFRFSLIATQEIGIKRAVGIANKANKDLENYFNNPANVARGWQYAFAKGIRPLPSDMESQNPLWYNAYWDIFAAAMRGSDYNLRTAGIIFADGNRVLCSSTINDWRNQALQRKQFVCRLVTWRKGYESDSNMTGNDVLVTFNRFDYSTINTTVYTNHVDPRRISSYTVVLHTPGANMWGKMLLESRLSHAIMGVSSTIFNETGTMLGVITISVDVRNIIKLVNSVVTTENSVLILIDSEDMVVGSTYYKPTMTRTNSFEKGKTPTNCLQTDSIRLCRKDITTYAYPPLNELQSSHPEIIDDGTLGGFQLLTLDGKDYYVVVAPIVTPNADGMNWRTILFLSVDDIMSGIIKGRNMAIYISISITIVSVIVSFMLVTLLLRPLNTLADDMYRVASMQDMGEVSANVSVTTGADVPGPLTEKSAEPSLSVFSEIATLQFAFNIMRTELAKIKSYLPQSVLAQLYGGDDFSDEGDLCNDIGSKHSGTSMASSQCQSADDIQSNSDRGSDSSQRRKYRKTPADAATVSTSHSGSNQSATLNTALSLTDRRVTMLSLNVVGYHTSLSAKDDYKISRIQTALVSALSSACSDHRGVMDGFQGDRFLASFNAVTSVGNHALQAVYAAHTACRAAETMHTPLVVTAGVASGSALVGNMGSATVKRFTILGHVVSTAATLERLAKRYRTDGGVLAGGAAVTDVENFFDLLTVDAAVLPISTASAGWRARIAAVMSPKSAASDEWMYELQEGSKKSRYGDANLAFAAFLEGDEAEASRIVEQLFDGKHDPDSMSVGEAQKKLMTAEPAIDGKRYVSPMTDFYQQCVLPSGNTAATNMSPDLVNTNTLTNRIKRGSSVMNICGDSCSSSLLSRYSSVAEMNKFGDSKIEIHGSFVTKPENRISQNK